jgi:hypothetical protein
MRRRLIGFALAAVLSASGCGGGDKPSVPPEQTSDGGSPGQSGGGAPTVPGAVAPASVVVSLALNDGTSEQVEQGTPLLLMGVVALRGNPREPFDVAADSIQLNIVSTKGEAQDWPLAPLEELPKSLALSGEQDQARAWWGLSAAQTQEIPVGSYVVELSVGEARSMAQAIEIGAPAALRDAGQLVRYARLQAQLFSLQGEAELAADVLEEALLDAPDDVGLRVSLSRAQAAAGQTDAAALNAETALAAAREQYPDEPEALLTPLEAQRSLTDQALFGGAP